MIEYILGAFSGGFLVFMLISVFMGRKHVDDEYEPDIYRSKDDDWEL